MHNKDKSGRSFEYLGKQIFDLLSQNDAYSSVELNVLLDSPDGPRQFDVAIRSTYVGTLEIHRFS
jgi:hypothetical protein